MIPYTLGIRFIMYVMICIRPDATYILSITSRYQSDPSEGH
jgi:predicted transcriptional regulator with HTH domain